MSGDRSIIRFLNDPQLFGPHFAGDSWSRWRAVLKGAFALPMTADELALFEEAAGGREPPEKPVRELVCAIGRGGGKDSVAAALATWVATTADTSHLRAGEHATVFAFAVDREQAAIAFGYIRAFFESIPLLRGMVRVRNRRLAIGDDTIELTNKARIVVGTNSRRAPRGRTIAAAIYDEAAFWFSEDYANPDFEVDAAVSPGLARFPGSLKIIISSVNKRSGLLYDRFARFYGKDDPDTLVVMGTSLEFNPTLDESIIEREIERDPERAQAEYLCRWRDDLSQFIDREMIEAAVDRNILVRPRENNIRYVAFADASSGRGDSFALAIAHKEPGPDFYILDCLYEKPSPFNVETAVDEAVKTLRSYGLDEVTGDKYAVGFVEEVFRRFNIRYITSERDKSSLYLEVLPLFTTGRVRLLHSPRLIHQFASLERRTSPIGKDSVSHPDHKNARDDLANAATGALTLAATRTPWVITDEMIATLEAGLIRRPGWAGIEVNWGGRPRRRTGVFF
jgi:hypothetical protein